MKIPSEGAFFNRTMPLWLLTAVCAGCSFDTAGEHIAEDQEAIGEASCATAAANATFDGTMDYQSPRTYSTPGCYKAVVVDVNDLNLQAPPGTHAALMVLHNDTPPTTQAACNNLWAGAYTYAHFDGVWEKVELISARGIWQANGTCWGPFLQLDNGMYDPGRDDNSYRVVATARTDQTTGAPTRRIRVFSQFRGN